MSNPEVILFFSVFLPQSVRSEDHLELQYATLAVLRAAIDCIIIMIYALGSRRAVRSFSTEGWSDG